MNETNKKNEKERAKLTTRRGMRLRKALLPVLSAWILIHPCEYSVAGLSAATIRIWLYSSNSWHSLESYAIFFSDFDGLVHHCYDEDEEQE